MNQLKKVQRLATRLVRGLRHVTYEEMQHLRKFCSPSLTFFSILLSQTIYVSLTPKPCPVYVAIIGPRGNSYHYSIK